MENFKLKIKNVKKEYVNKTSKTEAIRDISFDIKDGEIIAVVGTSGCGKSTLLNIISGLDVPTDGVCLFDKENPRISYMLQSDALLPWRSVLDNACLGLELLKEKTPENIGYVESLLGEYGLKEFVDAKPNRLSGGMRQRVALIRSLAIKPDILLLDEPFSALDYYTRITIAEDVARIIKKTKTTTIIITHDIAEALSFADRVVVLSSRPSIVKKIYNVDLPENSTILKKRGLKEFNDLYEKVWRDLDVQI